MTPAMDHDRENLDWELEAFARHPTDLSRLTIDETAFLGTGGYTALHHLAAIDLHLAFIRLIQV